MADDVTSVGERLQGLSLRDQSVVLARVAAGRSDDAGFAPADVLATFDAVSLVRPARISNILASLKAAGLVTQKGSVGRWWLTPIGRAESIRRMPDDDLHAVLAEGAAHASSLLGRLVHPVLPPNLAPVDISRVLKDFLLEHPFETNVFAMTRFPPKTAVGTAPTDPLALSLAAARNSCGRHGLTLHFASDRALVDDLWGNVLAHMWACQYGIAVFEDHADRGLNYNLTIEVGGMLLAGRRTVLLKDSTVPAMPTDLVGHIYRSVDLGDPSTVSTAIHEWIRDDLRLGECPGCPS